MVLFFYSDYLKQYEHLVGFPDVMTRQRAQATHTCLSSEICLFRDFSNISPYFDRFYEANTEKRNKSFIKKKIGSVFKCFASFDSLIL